MHIAVRIIVLFLFLSLGSRSCSLAGYEYCKLGLGKKLEVKEKLSQDDRDGVPRLRRKYKPKGIQVIVPCISRLVFTDYYTYTEPGFTLNQGYISHSYKEYQRKRGPPTI